MKKVLLKTAAKISLRKLRRRKVLKPKDNPGGKTQERTCEHHKGKLRQQREKQEFYQRNPHRKWGDR